MSIHDYHWHKCSFTMTLFCSYAMFLTLCNYFRDGNRIYGISKLPLWLANTNIGQNKHQLVRKSADCHCLMLRFSLESLRLLYILFTGFNTAPRISLFSEARQTKAQKRISILSLINNYKNPISISA